MMGGGRGFVKLEKKDKIGSLLFDDSAFCYTFSKKSFPHLFPQQLGDNCGL
jgi:hypothetical protein